jgi:hypothetical protein
MESEEESWRVGLRTTAAVVLVLRAATGGPRRSEAEAGGAMAEAMEGFDRGEIESDLEGNGSKSKSKRIEGAARISLILLLNNVMEQYKVK